MTERDQVSSELSRTGCLTALALVLIPAVAAFSLGVPLSEEWPFALFFGLLLAAPFGYLALEGTKAWLPWAVAVVLSACFWGALSASIIISARDQTGVNFGMGLVMLGSPFVVTGGAWLALQSTKRRRR